jgi:hypothetical protein
MKKLIFAVLALAQLALAPFVFAQTIPPPREATAQEAQAGTSSSTYISPRRLLSTDIPAARLGVMSGASAGAAGAKGAVPAPAAGDQNKVLYADGTWKSITNAAAATDAEAIAATDTTKFLTPATGLEASLQGVVQRRLNDVLSSDGNTSNRAVVWTLGATGAIAGLPLSIPFEFDVPTANPTASAFIFAFLPNATANPVATANTLLLRIATDGQLHVEQWGAAAGTDFRRFSHPTFRATWSGQRVRGVVVFSAPNTSTSPVVYINGIDVSASFAATTGGTPPNWVSSSVASTVFVVARDLTHGFFVPHPPIVGAFSAADVVTWTQTGRFPRWAEVSVFAGLSSGLLTGDSTSFAASLGSWTNGASGTNLWTTLNATTVAGKMYAVAPGSGSCYVRLGNIFASRVGWRYLATGRVRLASGTAVQLSLGMRDGTVADGGRFALPTATGVEQSFSGVFTVNEPSGDLVVGILAGANSSAYEFDDLQIIPIGPSFRPAIRSSRVIPDLSGNRVHGVLQPGIVAVSDEYRGPIIQTALVANGELIDTNGTLPPDSVIEDIVVRNTTANTVFGFGVGSTSGGDQLTYRVDVPGNTTLILPIKRADAAFLTGGSYIGLLGTAFGRVYYSASSWNSGSLNISVRFRRERGI